MNTGTIKNVLDAVRDWVNNKEQAYKPGEIYETVPDEIIKMLWDGDVVFGDLVSVSGARGLYPVDPVTNYLHFLEIFYGREETINMIKQNALTFTNTGNNAVSFKFYSENNVDLPVLYVVDDVEGLVELKINENYTIPAGGSIKIVGNNPKGNIGVDCTRGFADWYGNTTIKVSGKLTSLIDVMGMTDVIPSTADFSKLFYSAPITDASELVLPTNVAPSCYEGMFIGCTSLITAPELPATTLADGCYYEMFSGCSSLTKAPELPATILEGFCYANMFNGCTSLNYIKCLAVNGINPNNSTKNWLSGVPSTGTFVKDTKANWPTGTSGIPTNWTATEEFKGLKFEAIEDSEFSWTCNVSSFENKFYYSLDDGKTWANYTAPIPFSKGTILCLKGDYPEGLSNNSRTVRFALSGKVKASGNIMSLIDNGACNTLTIPSNYCFRELFRDCTSLITPPELPATTLAQYCYQSMFYGCTSLVYPPELPATTLSDGCYDSMFGNCSSLIKAPELPATTLASYCYNFMFSGCSSLVYPPELSATTLAEYCYESMFSDCSSLVYPPALPATTLAERCYISMFNRCINLMIAPELPATTLVHGCYWSMFNSCFRLIKAPVLTANILAQNCYSNMFYSCSNLHYIKCLAGNNINTNNTAGWLYGVPSTGTFVKNPEANWPTGDSGIPSGWEVVDAK